MQHGVDRSRLGIATSLNQFARSIGAAVGVAAMGADDARVSGVDLPGGIRAGTGGGVALTGPHAIISQPRCTVRPAPPYRRSTPIFFLPAVTSTAA